MFQHSTFVPTETIVTPALKIFAHNGTTKVKKHIHNVKIIAAGRNVEYDTLRFPSCQQHILDFTFIHRQAHIS